MPTIKVISTQQHGQDQTTHYEQTLQVVEPGVIGRVVASLRLTIHTDSHTSQAYAYVDVWSHETWSWNRLHWIPGACMATPGDLGYSVAYRDSSHREEFYVDDRKELLRVALAVLEIKKITGDTP